MEDWEFLAIDHIVNECSWCKLPLSHEACFWQISTKKKQRIYKYITLHKVTFYLTYLTYQFCFCYKVKLLCYVTLRYVTLRWFVWVGQDLFLWFYTQTNGNFITFIAWFYVDKSVLATCNRSRNVSVNSYYVQVNSTNSLKQPCYIHPHFFM